MGYLTQGGQSKNNDGCHGERSVAIGTIDMAIWDAVAKIEDKPLFQLLADRYGTPLEKILNCKFVTATGATMVGLITVTLIPSAVFYTFLLSF